MDNGKMGSIIFGENESTEALFEKIKGWEITSQIDFTVSLDNPKRKELFEKIFESVNNETVKQNISLIIQRIEQAAFQVSGYTVSEIEYYQSLFAKHFYTVLNSDNYQTYIEDKIRELHFYCKGLELDLRTKQYEFLEDREQDKSQLAEAERYKVYLENILIQLNKSTQQQPPPEKAKTPPPSTKKTPKIQWKHHALGYLLDCHADGIKPASHKYNQKALEDISIKRTGKSSNNFSKQYRYMMNYLDSHDINSLKTLEKLGGENWREIVLSISVNRDKLDKYLKDKNL